MNRAAFPRVTRVRAPLARALAAVVAVLTALAAAAPAAAHPGHGDATAGWLHDLRAPEHVATLALVALGSAAGGALLARALRAGGRGRAA